MDEILAMMMQRLNLTRKYNPAAPYVKKRRVVVDWMCEMGEDLKFEPETIHHSIFIFDSFLQIQNI